jgi:hypothetical protein
LGATQFNKDFLAIFQTFWDKVFNSKRIAQNAFKKTGLIPLEPLVVLEKMKDYKQLKKKGVNSFSSNLFSSTVFTTLSILSSCFCYPTTPHSSSTRRLEKLASSSHTTHTKTRHQLCQRSDKRSNKWHTNYLLCPSRTR